MYPYWRTVAEVVGTRFGHEVLAKRGGFFGQSPQNDRVVNKGVYVDPHSLPSITLSF